MEVLAANGLARWKPCGIEERIPVFSDEYEIGGRVRQLFEVGRCNFAGSIALTMMKGNAREGLRGFFGRQNLKKAVAFLVPVEYS